MLTNCDRNTEERVTWTTACNDELKTKILNLVKVAAEKDGLINLREGTNNSNIFQRLWITVW